MNYLLVNTLIFSSLLVTPKNLSRIYIDIAYKFISHARILIGRKTQESYAIFGLYKKATAEQKIKCEKNNYKLTCWLCN